MAGPACGQDLSRAAGGGKGRVHAKIAAPRALAPNPPPCAARPAGRATTKIRIMDIERINAIGNQIADLSERTTALRGYL